MSHRIAESPERLSGGQQQRVYVEVFRNTLVLAQLFIIYFGLAYIDIRIPAYPAAIIGLGLNGGAVLSEVFRAGFAAIHHGQREAALAVGMTPWDTVRYVILCRIGDLVQHMPSDDHGHDDRLAGAGRHLGA